MGQNEPHKSYQASPRITRVYLSYIQQHRTHTYREIDIHAAARQARTDSSRMRRLKAQATTHAPPRVDPTPTHGAHTAHAAPAAHVRAAQPAGSHHLPHRARSTHSRSAHRTLQVRACVEARAGAARAHLEASLSTPMCSASMYHDLGVLPEQREHLPRARGGHCGGLVAGGAWRRFVRHACSLAHLQTARTKPPALLFARLPCTTHRASLHM